jgi:hypothetical protein
MANVHERGRLHVPDEREDSAVLLRRLEAMRDDLVQRGVLLPPGLRILRYIDSHARFLDTLPQDEATARRVIAAKVEGRMLVDAYERLSAPPEVPGWLEKIEQAIHGNELARPVENDPRAVQSELWFASRLRNAGFDITLASPDILAKEPDGYTLGFEVKRPRSWKGVKDSLRAAVHQFRAADLTGAIVLDCSYLLSTHEAPPWGTEFDLRALGSELNNQLIRLQKPRPILEGHLRKPETVQRWVEEVTEGDRIAGVIAFVALGMIDRDRHIFLTSRPMIGDHVHGFRDARAAQTLRSLFPAVPTGMVQVAR